jgi:hypothetical protein
MMMAEQEETKEAMDTREEEVHQDQRNHWTKAKVYWSPLNQLEEVPEVVEDPDKVTETDPQAEEEISHLQVDHNGVMETHP